MSWLRIRHHTRYAYDRPVHFGRHRLVLRPREGHDLRVESMTLTIAPAHELGWHRDIFGNSVAEVDFLEAAKELSIHNDVLIRRSVSSARGPAPDPEEAAWPVVYDPIEKPVADAYLQSVYPQDVDKVRAWLDTKHHARPANAEEALAWLNALVNREFRYARREEKGVFTPAQTIVERRGSCRDLATLLLEAARAWGVAARFASGYLECTAAEAGHASTHAWVEAYLPGYGWRGYDPTSGRNTTLQHVVTGVSNHPRGVMPVSGLFFGERSSFKSLSVSVQMGQPEAPAERENDALAAE